MARHLFGVMCLLLCPKLAFSQILRPTAYTHTNTGFTNPTNAYDTNAGTSANLSFGRLCSSGAGTSTSGTTWHGFAAGWAPTRLFVKWSTNGNANFSGMTARSKLEYSTNGGANWQPFPNQSFQAPPTFGTQIAYVNIPFGAGIASENVQVRVIPEITSSGSCSFGSAAVSAYVYDIYMSKCGDVRDTIISEYVDYSVNWVPTCSDFSSRGGTNNFSWSELNGGFTDGNPHTPWGIVRQALKDNLELTRTNYNRGGITLSSGYRCPHGNDNVGGVQNSNHMKGVAADMFSSDYQWTEDEFNLLRAAANLTGPTESFVWATYSDHHYHAAWE
jgi:hypothetical protein